MAIKLNSSIPIISIIAFGIFSVSFFFNVGVLTQINASAFLEEFDDKKKLIKDAREKLFDFKTDALKKMICLFPYFVSIVFCYSVSPLVIEFIKKHFSNYLPTEYRIDIFIFFLLFEIFSIGEAFWGVNEKNIERKEERIHYNRPLYLVLFISALFIGAYKLESAIGMEEKQSIMTFLHIYNIETFQLMYIFSMVVFLNNLHVAKWISRYVVLIDSEIYISHLKEKNYGYSFYGMANLLLSLLVMFISIFLAVKYSIWKEINVFAVVWALLMMMQISVLAGQRDYFVSITRRKCIKKNMVYYQDVNGKEILIDDGK
ncbi:hypothetical protein H7E67_17660 [Clostridium gasigenes]|uniref:hypothetical protein n=1 Tax=Clostridium gasigenes TaxID=94869 RepID=UPI001623257F|nr:hypothetical protein [Clostridium gasigenes]MBB6625245.1 hypothetical protein [Clostridium gasigenes]